MHLFQPGSVRFAETDEVALTAALRAEVDARWAAASHADAALFDGPVVICTGFTCDERGDVEVRWTRTSYRYSVLRRIPQAPPLSSVFVCVVQPVHGSGVAVGRTTTATARPGLWQLPGGSVGPPPDGAPLTLDLLRARAARELVEETGLRTDAHDLELWRCARMGNGNVGFFFTAPVCDLQVLEASHAVVSAAAASRGGLPEFDRVVGTDRARLASLGGAPADHLEGVLAEHTSSREQRR